MKNITFEDKFWEVYFKKICFIVMANYEEIDFFNDEYWYQKHSWNSSQEQECIDWLLSFLQMNKYLIPIITNKKKISEKKLKDFVEYFVFNFGWKCVDDSAYIRSRKKSIWNSLFKGKY